MILKGLDAVCARLARRTPEAQHRSLVGVIRRDGGGPDGEESPAVGLSLASASHTPPVIDEARACARFVCSTADRDRHGDVVLPSAFKKWLPVYEKNPRGFFSHRSADYPVFSCRDPHTRAFSVELHPDKLVAGFYFHLKTQESHDVWELVRAGELEACSIGFLPHEAVLLGPDGLPMPEDLASLQEGDEIGFDAGGLEFTEVELLEISVVPVPANRAALAERLAKGLVKSAAVRESLKAYVPEKRAWAPGFSPAPASPEPKPPAAMKDAPATLPEEPLRWNKEAPAAFDVSKQKFRPARLEYDLVARHMGCKIKHVYQNAVAVPAAKIGSFLSAWRDVVGPYALDDVRNLTYEGREAPPAYETIRLNSQKSDDFLVDGVCFYTGRADPQSRFAAALQPTYYGLQVTLYTRSQDKALNLRLVEQAWELAASQYNFLKGEAFSLSGQFLPKTGDSWDGLFLDAKNEKSLRSTIKQLNEKQLDFANRGAIFTGPPGTGKTLSGRVLRNEADATFIWISARDFYYAGSFGGFAYAFELAKELAPCVLFYEDVDHWLGDTAVDLLKTEMDGMGRYKGVWTVLTTNFPEELPEALIDRPGRFHDVLLFAVPDDDVRKKMIARWLPGLGAEARELAVSSTAGYSGAHVYELCHFAKTIEEQEGKALCDALDDALAKVREQRQLVTSTQNARRRGGNSWKSALGEQVKQVGAYAARLLSHTPHAPKQDQPPMPDHRITKEDMAPEPDPGEVVHDDADKLEEIHKSLTDLHAKHDSMHEMVKAMHGVVCAEDEDDDKEDDKDVEDPEEAPEGHEDKDAEDGDDDEDDKKKPKKSYRPAARKSAKKAKRPVAAGVDVESFAKLVRAVAALAAGQRGLNEKLFELTGQEAD